MPLTPQDWRDLAVPPEIPPAGPQADAAPPGMASLPIAGIWRLIRVRPPVETWRGPYVRYDPPLVGRYLRGIIIEGTAGSFGYEIAFPQGDGAVVRRQHGFHTPAAARHGAQWELDRLEGLLTNAPCPQPPHGDTRSETTSTGSRESATG